MDPGKTHTYIWEIQQNQGPTDGDSPCLTHSYSSNIDSVKDTNSGLIGALLVCRPGKSNPGWGQVRCSHELRGRGIKDTFQRLSMAVGSVCWPFPQRVPSQCGRQTPLDFPTGERTWLIFALAKFQTTDEIFCLVAEPYLLIR